MQCSDPASEVVPEGQMEHNIVLRFLNEPEIQEQPSEPEMEAERSGQGSHAAIPEVL